MAYTLHNNTTPNPTSQNGTQAFDSTRNNINALRDAAILGGGFIGFNLTVSGGTAEQPTTFVYNKGVERVRAVVTWGTTGGEDGNVTVAVYSYSSNSGGSYDSMGTKTITYDGSANVTATTWS